MNDTVTAPIGPQPADRVTLTNLVMRFVSDDYEAPLPPLPVDGSRPSLITSGDVLVAWITDTLAQVSALQAERDILRDQLSDARALRAGEAGEWERVITELKQLRPIVVAAVAWRKAGIFGLGTSQTFEEAAAAVDRADKELRAAVDAYFAVVDQTAPETGLSATQDGQDGETVGTDAAMPKTDAQA